MIIGVVGLWHLGCIIATSWAKLGNKVIGFDKDMKRINELKNGHPPIYEPELEENIRENIKKKNIIFTSNIKDVNKCDYIFLSYDTPVNEDDIIEDEIIINSINELKKVMKDESILIVSSQSPAGLCKRLRAMLIKKNRTIDLAYSPENLRLGEALECYLNPSRIIIGTNNEKTKIKCIKLFSQIKAELIFMNIESAEMVKHCINSFLANSIVFSNNIAEICEMIGADIVDVVKGMKADKRIGEKAYLSPGIGFSGGTLGRDLKALQGINDSNGGSAKLFEIIHQLNRERKHSICERIRKILGKMNDKTIAVLGVTYKPGTSTLRRSRPLEIISLLIKEGVKIRVFDPKANFLELKEKPNYIVVKSAVEAADNADMIVLLTEWNDFRNIDWKSIKIKMKKAVIFDTKNVLDKNRLVESGFEYYGVGRKEWDN